MFKQFYDKLSVKQWTFDGNSLVNPITLIRRLIFYPAIFITKWIYLFTVLCGWGIDEMIFHKNELD